MAPLLGRVSTRFRLVEGSRVDPEIDAAPSSSSSTLLRFLVDPGTLDDFRFSESSCWRQDRQTSFGIKILTQKCKLFVKQANSRMQRLYLWTKTSRIVRKVELEANRLLTKVWPAAGPVCITRPNKCGKDQGYLRAN